MTLPSLVIVSGPPASGKTSLARPLARNLGMPLFAKDATKERIADTLGPETMQISGRIGHAAMLLLYDTARELLEAGQSVLLEAFFHHGKAEPDLAPLITIADAVLVHCTADNDILLQRYAERIGVPERHTIHGDAHRIDDMRAYIEQGVTDPLDLPIPRLMIDTTNSFPDPTKVAEHVRNVLEALSRKD